MTGMERNGRPVKAVFNWSGGKDSALALLKVLQGGEYELVSLLTTVNRENRRSSMHGIPVSLQHRQADSIGLPLHVAQLPPQGGTRDYDRAMAEAVGRFRTLGATHFIFGDVFLSDVRAYREERLAPHGIAVVEPLWGKTSAEVVEEFLASGLRATVVVTAADVLDERFVGRPLDRAFVGALPADADVCGENGEYHTFCHAGGMFRTPVPFRLEKPVKRTFPVRLDDGTTRRYAYWFSDLHDPEE